MKKSDDLAKNTILLTVGTIFAKGIQFVMIPFVSRWLSVEAYGRFDLLMTYVTLLIPILSLSTGEAMFRFSASCETKEEQAPFVTNGLVVVVLNLVLCVGLIALLASKNIISGYLVGYFALLLAAQLLNNYFHAFLRGIKNLKLFTASNIVIAALIAILSVVFVRVFRWELRGLIAAYAVAYLAGNAVIAAAAKFWEYLSVRSLSRAAVAQLIKYSLPLIPNDVSWWILDLSDRQVIAIVLGTAANGIYAIANKIPALCTTVFGMFSISWQQSMVEKIDNDDWPLYANKIYNQMLVVLLTLCSGILSVTFLLFKYIFDTKYAVAALYVPILITAAIFSSLMKFFGGIQIALKKTSENGMTTVAGAAVNLAVDIALIRGIGLYAAALSTLLANVTTTLLRQYRLRKKVSFTFEKKTAGCILLYGYFTVCSYLLKGNMIFGLMNIGVAGAAFILLNRKLLLNIIRR